MSRAFSRIVALFVVGAAVGCATTGGIITVQPTQPTMGGAIATCELAGNDLVLAVSATCVVDSAQRIVVLDQETDEVVFDSRRAPTRLPNFPKHPGFVPVALGCQCAPKPPQHKRLLLVQLSGDCGSEHASGSFTCSILREDSR
jgi:hypothetical protein